MQLRCNSLIQRFFPFQKISISHTSRFVGDQNITILTLKTGLYTRFFTEKRYRSNNTGSINSYTSNASNIIRPGLFNIRIKVLNSELRNSVEGHFSAVTVEPPTDLYHNFCTKRDTKLVNNTQQTVVNNTVPATRCTACRISLPLSSQDPSGLNAN